MRRYSTFRLAQAVVCVIAQAGAVLAAQAPTAIPPGATAGDNRREAFVYLNRGALAARQGKDAEAVADFKRSIELSPDDIRIYKIVDQFFARNHQWADMVPYWNKYLAAHPDDGAAYCQRGGNYSWLHQNNQALADYDKACGLGNQTCCLLARNFRANLAARATPAGNPNNRTHPKEEHMASFVTFLFVLLILFGIGTFFSGLFTVATARAAVVQRFGKFVRVAGAGLNFKLPWIEQVAARVDLRVQQLDVKMETKTKDNVFVSIPVSVQYHVLPDRVYEAYYKLSDPKEQIASFVFNVILGHVPKMNLDEAFEQQNDIATAVKQELDGVMAGFGYGIVKALVTDIIPDPKVKAAMNDINAARREQEAANARGEAEKILKVKQAEAEAESKQLQGQGIANQRKAIIDGLRESVEAFKASVEGTTAKDVMVLVLLTQYFDTLKEIGASAHSNTIMMPHSPGGMADFFEQVRNAVTAGELVSSTQQTAATQPAPAAAKT